MNELYCQLNKTTNYYINHEFNNVRKGIILR